MKSGFVIVVGRPSSGKSTLVNRICGHKVSIVAAAPQTTRNAIRGIYTAGESQLVFVDTPGYHTSERRFNQHMVSIITGSFEDIDLVLYLVDASRPPGAEDRALRDLVHPYSDRLFVALNKVDLADRRSDGRKGPAPEERGMRAAHRALLDGIVEPARLFEVSGRDGTGVEELIAALLEAAPEGEPFYPEEFYTDQDPEFRAAEIIREQAIVRLRQELPHSVFIEIADIELSEDGAKLWIRAFLYVERESQKGIAVGKKGSVIRAIRLASLRELRKLFPQEIELDLQVKVSKEWRKNEQVLNRLIR